MAEDREPALEGRAMGASWSVGWATRVGWRGANVANKFCLSQSDDCSAELGGRKRRADSWWTRRGESVRAGRSPAETLFRCRLGERRPSKSILPGWGAGRSVRTIASLVVTSAVLVGGMIIVRVEPAAAVDACAKTTTFSCLAQFGYGGGSTGTWAETWYRYDATSGYHNCTRFAAFYMQRFHGIVNPGSSFGNAWNWGLTNAEGGDPGRTSLKERGYLVNGVPAVGAIAWRTKSTGYPLGHVGVVVSVSGDNVLVASDNYSPTSVGTSDISWRLKNYFNGYIHVEPADRAPTGWLDLAESTEGGRVRVRGWASDPDTPTSAVRIHVYVGGPAGSGAPGFDIGLAGGYRSDVAAAVPGIGPYHGFDTSISVPQRSSVAVYAYAINTRSGYANTQLNGAPKTVTVATNLSWNLQQGTIAKDIAMATVAGGWEMFHIGTDDRIYRKIMRNGSVSGWTALSGPRARRIATATFPDGRVELFYIGMNNAVYHHWERTPGGDLDTWEGLGGYAKEIAATRSGSGWEVFHVGSDNAIYRARSWNRAWERMAGTWAWDIAAATSRDGRVELFHIGNGRNVWHAWQSSPGSSFGGWVNRGGVTYSIGATNVGNGEWEFFAIGGGNSLWRIAPWSGVTDWQHLSGAGTAIVAAKNSDGRVEVLHIGGGGGIYHSWQRSIGNF